VAAFAKGGATVRLESESPEVTILHHEVDARIGGKLAQLGQRLKRPKSSPESFLRQSRRWSRDREGPSGRGCLGEGLAWQFDGCGLARVIARSVSDEVTHASSLR
jgi:hypothetical protein